MKILPILTEISWWTRGTHSRSIVEIRPQSPRSFGDTTTHWNGLWKLRTVSEDEDYLLTYWRKQGVKVHPFTYNSKKGLFFLIYSKENMICLSDLPFAYHGQFCHWIHKLKRNNFFPIVTCWTGYMENKECILWSWRSSSFAVSSSSGGVRSRRDGSSGSGLHDCKSKMLLEEQINKINVVYF